MVKTKGTMGFRVAIATFFSHKTPYIGNVIIPTAELMFFRVVGQPPTSNPCESSQVHYDHYGLAGLREAGSVGDRGPSHLGTAQQCAQRWVQSSGAAFLEDFMGIFL
jgi:hypothetical protein